jgi:hypothetical protein
LSVVLTEAERAVATGEAGEGVAMAMRIVADAARLLGAPRLIPIASAHIDGALYHGDSGTLFAERLVEGGAEVAVRSTLNVGALDLTGCAQVRLAEPQRRMARRMMDAYRALGCETSWTCAPYQAGHRPEFGTDVAWGESNAVAFCNSVLGARTNRYGDFLDIACAITGPGARLWSASAGKSARETGLRRFGARRRLVCRRNDLAGTGQPLWTRSRRCGRRDRRRCRPSRRGRAEGFRRGGGFLWRCRAVSLSRRNTGSAGPRHCSWWARAGNRDPGHAPDAGRCSPPALHCRATGPHRRGGDRKPASVARRIRRAGVAAGGPKTRRASLRLHEPPRGRRTRSRWQA